MSSCASIPTSTRQAHASTIVDTPNGLLAAWFGGEHEGHAATGIWLSRHRGIWRQPECVASGSEAHWNPVLFRTKSGVLHLYYKVGRNPKRWRPKRMESHDEGETWEGPFDLLPGLMGPDRNKPVQLNSGRIICPSSREPSWMVHFEISDDDGETWRVVSPQIDGMNYQAIQPTVMPLPDGDIVALCRNRKGKVLKTDSTDGGITWSALEPGGFPNPNSALDGIVLSQERYLVACNDVPHCGRIPNGRHRLSILVGGMGRCGPTLRPVVVADSPGEYSYPAIIQASDGSIHLTYTHNRTHIEHVTFEAAELQ